VILHLHGKVFESVLSSKDNVAELLTKLVIIMHKPDLKIIELGLFSLFLNP
jgi:hypothetical protein